MKDMNAKINAAPTAAPAAADAKAPAQAFDIAKFAGIFAALGMAVGMIGTALTSIFKGIFALKWWQLLMVFVGIMLVISGPAMVMAWMKLRRRNIAPLLNANRCDSKTPMQRRACPHGKSGLSHWRLSL